MSRPEHTELVARTLGALGTERAWVVHGADGLGDARLDLRRRRLVHELAHGFDGEVVADAQDVDGHRARDQRIEDGPSRQGREDEAGEHANGGDDVREQVMAVAFEGRRAPGASAADQHRGPGGVDRRGDAADHQTGRRLVQRARGDQGLVGLVKDDHRRDDDQRALQHGGEVFGLVVPERVTGIGRLRADADGDERHHGGQHVDDAFERVGEERHAPRHQEGGVLDAQHGQRHDNGGDGNSLVAIVARHDGRLHPCAHRRCGSSGQALCSDVPNCVCRGAFPHARAAAHSPRARESDG